MKRHCGNWWILQGIHRLRQTDSRFNTVLCVMMKQTAVYTTVLAGQAIIRTGTVAEERPSAYIIMVTPQDVNPQWDEGIAGQTILLAAAEQGLGGCFIGNIRKEKLAAVLNLPEGYKVDLCIALGYPKEEVVLEDIAGDGDIHYYRDDNQVQHVPKKKLDDILI